MRSLLCASCVAVALWASWGFPFDVRAQQATIATPFQSIGDSFFEQIGTSWGVRGRGFDFRFGGGNLGAPTIGGANPAAGLQGGWAGVGPWGSGYLNFVAAQGSRRGMVSQTPSATMLNGGMAIVSDTSISPFVISYIPVVGGFPSVGAVMPMMPPPMPVDQGLPALANPAQVEALRQALADRRRQRAQQERDALRGQMHDGERVEAAELPDGGLRLLGAGTGPSDAGAAAPLVASGSSSATRSAPSVAEAARLRQLEQSVQEEEAAALWQRALAAEEAGKPNVAKLLYQMVARRAEGTLRDEALRRAKELAAEASAPR